jgi:hypothetical protein
MSYRGRPWQLSFRTGPSRTRVTCTGLSLTTVILHWAVLRTCVSALGLIRHLLFPTGLSLTPVNGQTGDKEMRSLDHIERPPKHLFGKCRIFFGRPVLIQPLQLPGFLRSKRPILSTNLVQKVHFLAFPKQLQNRERC